jgi:serine/threonine protein kinase
MYKVYETPDCVHLVFEYVSTGDLYAIVKRKNPFSEQFALSLIAQIMLGVTFLHSEKYVHRDLNPNNIFLL